LEISTFLPPKLKKMDLFPLGLTEVLRAYREGRATVQDYVAS